MARTRTFIAVDIGDETRKSAVALQQRLARAVAGVKWTEAEGMHITLLFLGEVDDRELVDVFRAVKSAAGREPPFAVQVSGVGAFPTQRRPKVLWAGITEGSAELRRVFGGIEASLMERGIYRKEERAYTPHLTLGRISGEAEGETLAAEIPKLADWNGGNSMVNEVLVYSSNMRREGPEYVVLGRSPLVGSGGPPAKKSAKAKRSPDTRP